MIRMKNEDGGGASVNGKEYQPDDKGIVTVDPEAVAELLGHGFKHVKDEPAKKEKTQAELDQEAKLAELVEAIKTAKAALKGDKDNAEKKAALDAAVEALKAAKA